ncbi:MAG: sulfotransferase, partial [Stenotrophomonas sp.]
LTRARLRRWHVDDHHVDGLRRQLQVMATDSEDSSALWFALYKELEDLGDFSQAWDALRQGNASMWRRLRHDRMADQAQHEAMAQLAAAGTFASAAAVEEDDGAQPIFIIGMPRSGTTVLERMLGNHSQIASAGELGDFAQQLRWAADQAGRALLDPALLQALPTLDYAAVGTGYLQQTRWRLDGQYRFIDKLPPNYLLAGPIARALPKAVIVYVRRDPMAVCFSNYRAMFGDSYGYSYDLDALAAHHAAHTQLMQAWQQHLPGRVLEIDYEAMVRDPDAALAQVLQRCGLAAESGGSDLTRNAAATATLSSVQVREPVHARNIDEWQRYANELAPLRERLRSGR